MDRTSRRAFLAWTGAAASAIAAGSVIGARAEEPPKAPAPVPAENYENQAKGIRILPGVWRPHYPWEHIAWISPSWPCQDYIWLDFPEAIFTSQGLLFLSHINPPIPTVYSNLPKVPWREIANGITFERELPNGVSFGGSVTKGTGATVDLELHIKNGSSEPLNNITLQTCAFLRGIKEFGDYTRENKFIHSPGSGWITMNEALKSDQETGKYGVGWRTKGKKVADLPVIATISNQADRLVAMTWFEDTLSMISNAGHPCMHADPQFKDLAAGQESAIHGRIIFFEGKLEDFDAKEFAL
jgi:hypothetical protein